MSREPLTLLDDEGRRVFAFDPRTDPYEVLFYIRTCFRSVGLASIRVR